MAAWVFRMLPALALAACAPAAPPTEPDGLQPFTPDYLGTQTRLLDGELVNFLVEMRGARSPADVADYAECVAAQYTLIRGYGFARHLRTNVDEEGGLWRGDAVYTVSPTLPEGLKKIDAEVVVETCRERGIPTV
jgi:hypothetical protein